MTKWLIMLSNITGISVQYMNGIPHGSAAGIGLTEHAQSLRQWTGGHYVDLNLFTAEVATCCRLGRDPEFHVSVPRF